MFEKGQIITFFSEGKEITGRFIEQTIIWNIIYLIVEESDNPDNFTYINTEKISSFFCGKKIIDKNIKKLQDNNIINQDGNLTKEVKANYNLPLEQSEFQDRLYKSKTFEIPKDNLIVEEPKLESPPIDNPKDRAISLAKLYEQRRLLMKEELSKKIKTPITPVEVEYGLPSFLRHPKK